MSKIIEVTPTQGRQKRVLVKISNVPVLFSYTKSGQRLWSFWGTTKISLAPLDGKGPKEVERLCRKAARGRVNRPQAVVDFMVQRFGCRLVFNYARQEAEYKPIDPSLFMQGV